MHCQTQQFDSVELSYYFEHHFIKCSIALNLYWTFYSILIIYFNCPSIWGRLAFRCCKRFPLFFFRLGISVFTVRVYGNLHHQGDVLPFENSPTINFCYESLLCWRAFAFCQFKYYAPLRAPGCNYIIMLCSWPQVHPILGNEADLKYVFITGTSFFENLKTYLCSC